MAQSNGALGIETLASEPAGQVNWSVVETVTGKDLSAGMLAVGVEDFRIEEHRTAENLSYYRKAIRLHGPFHFAIDEHPDRRREDLKGFAMMGLNDEVQTYSWEWFNVCGPNEAAKLQEEGKIAIEVEESACGFEVVRTEFLTDVSLRLTRFFGDPTKEPFWRIQIRRGSWVCWPPGV